MRLGADNPNWKGGPVDRECAGCGRLYVVKRGNIKTSRFCSTRCSGAAGTAARLKALGFERKRTKPKVTRAQPYSRIRPARKCGHLTKAKRDYCRICSPTNKPVFKPCAVCGIEMKLSPSTAKQTAACSKQCRTIHQSRRQTGELSHFWQGGKTAETRRERNGYRTQEWRKLVFKRDDYTCVLCSERGNKLCADHILPWSVFPELRFTVENGRTLCRACHLTLPTTGFALAALRKAIAQRAPHDTRDPRIFLAFLWVCHPSYYDPSMKLWANWKPKHGLPPPQCVSI